MVIDDGDSPPDQEQEQLLAEPQSPPSKGQESTAMASAQGLGLPSRPPSQPSGDPGMGLGCGCTGSWQVPFTPSFPALGSVVLLCQTPSPPTPLIFLC